MSVNDIIGLATAPMHPGSSLPTDGAGPAVGAVHLSSSHGNCIANTVSGFTVPALYSMSPSELDSWLNSEGAIAEEDLCHGCFDNNLDPDNDPWLREYHREPPPCCIACGQVVCCTCIEQADARAGRKGSPAECALCRAAREQGTQSLKQSYYNLLKLCNKFDKSPGRYAKEAQSKLGARYFFAVPLRNVIEKDIADAINWHTHQDVDGSNSNPGGGPGVAAEPTDAVKWQVLGAAQGGLQSQQCCVSHCRVHFMKGAPGYCAWGTAKDPLPLLYAEDELQSV